MRLLRLTTVLLLCGLQSSCVLWRARPPVYDTVALENGLVYQDEVIPEAGPIAASGDAVAVHYEMWLANGEKVDSSLDRSIPIEFVLGHEQVPVGFELGVIGMRLFGRRVVVVPPELGYGEEGIPSLIPPDSPLHLHLELIELHPVADPGP